MKKIVIATAEPAGNYHFASFDEKHSRGLTHLIPSVGEPQGKSLVPTSDNMDIIGEADLVVLVGGEISEWTRHIGFMANEAEVPVVFSEMAYTTKERAEYILPIIDAYSSISPYGMFNLKGYFNEDDLEVEITGHPFLDNLPTYAPDSKRILIISSVFKADAGVELRKSVKALEAEGYNVVVRPHPREMTDAWKGFQLSDEPNLIRDLARAETMLGVPGTAFIAATALGVPSLAIEGSNADGTLPEFKYLFRYVHASDVVGAVNGIPLLDDKSRKFLTGPVGIDEDGKNSADRLVEFWHSNIGKY